MKWTDNDSSCISHTFPLFLQHSVLFEINFKCAAAATALRLSPFLSEFVHLLVWRGREMLWVLLSMPSSDKQMNKTRKLVGHFFDTHPCSEEGCGGAVKERLHWIINDLQEMRTEKRVFCQKRNIQWKHTK